MLRPLFWLPSAPLAVTVSLSTSGGTSIKILSCEEPAPNAKPWIVGLNRASVRGSEIPLRSKTTGITPTLFGVSMLEPSPTAPNNSSPGTALTLSQETRTSKLSPVPTMPGPVAFNDGFSSPPTTAETSVASCAGPGPSTPSSQFWTSTHQVPAVGVKMSHNSRSIGVVLAQTCSDRSACPLPLLSRPTYRSRSTATDSRVSVCNHSAPSGTSCSTVNTPWPPSKGSSEVGSSTRDWVVLSGTTSPPAR